MEKFKVKSYIEGPRWYNIEGLIRKMAWPYDVKILFMDTDKGWFTKTVRYEIEGTEEQLLRFRKELLSRINELNA